MTARVRIPHSQADLVSARWGKDPLSTSVHLSLSVKHIQDDLASQVLGSNPDAWYSYSYHPGSHLPV